MTPSPCKEKRQQQLFFHYMNPIGNSPHISFRDLIIGQDYYATVTLLCGAFPPLIKTCYNL